MKNEMAINELRAELREGLARLDWLSTGLPAVPEAISPPEVAGYQAGSAAEAGGPGPWGDGRG